MELTEFITKKRNELNDKIEAAGFELMKKPNNSTATYQLNNYKHQLKMIDKAQTLITSFENSSFNTEKAFMLCLDFYREISASQSSNKEDIEELRRYATGYDKKNVSATAKIETLCNSIIDAYENKYLEDVKQNMKNLVIAILSNFLMIRTNYCNFVLKNRKEI